MSRTEKFQNALLAAFFLGILGLFLSTVFSRLGYPYDLEWMEGGVLLHGHRVLNGKELYPYPSETYIPFIYPPLYYWLLAGVSWFSELDYQAGRILSICGGLLSCAAIVRALRWEGISWWIALCGGGFFLSTYEDTGAFLDIVRADGILLALMSWSLVWVREGKIRMGAIALALAFATKHNAAIMGFPIAYWLWKSTGWRSALSFGLWSAVPALVFLGTMQLGTDGRFLTYLLEVPAHHPFVLWRLTWLSSYEILSAHLLISLTGLGLYLWFCAQKLRSVKNVLGFSGACIVLVMILFAKPMEGFLAESIPFAGVAPKMVGRNAMGVLFCLSLVMMFFGKPNKDGDSIFSRYHFWILCSGVAWVFSGIMRAHHGGYSNVLLPGMWGSSLCCGFLLHELWTRFPFLRWGWVFLVGGHFWTVSWQPSTLIPTSQDVLAGDRLIARLKEIDGPVFSPHAPWYPVIAGKEPSAHLIALWDINHKGGPFYSSVQVIEDAMAKRTFSAILLANTKEDYGRKKFYRKRERFVYPNKKVFFPKKGWRVRPQYLYFPKDYAGDSKK